MMPTVEAMSPWELLHDASRLLQASDVLPAAVMARAALDTHLRGLGAMFRRGRRYNGLAPLIDALRSIGVLSVDQARTLKQLVSIGNRAAHNYVGVIAWDVRWMIDQVRVILEELEP